MKTVHRSEKGQIIILFIFGLMGLLGLTALAIDGGMVYSDRRFDQSVADAAALAGAGAAAERIASVNSDDYACTQATVIAAMTDAVNEAIATGISNGFSGTAQLLPWDLTTHHGVNVVCRDTDPSYLEVQVELSSITNTSLLHIVTGQREIPINAKSKVRIYGKSGLVPGAAIVGLSPYCQGNTSQPYGIEWDGTGETTVIDGGIFSNGGIYSGGSNDITAESMRTIADVPVRCPDGFRGNEDNLTIPEDAILNGPEDGVEPVVIDIDDMDCSGYPASVRDNSTTPPTWSAGTHSSEVTGSAIFEPGLHCLADGLRLTGNGDSITGDGVTFYVQGGDFIIGGSGNNTVSAVITAPVDENGGPPAGVPGMLIHVDKDNTGALVKLIGNSSSTFGGTIYNPKGTIEAGGDSTTPTEGFPMFPTQFIGWNIKVHGGPGFSVLYEESGFYQYDAYLDQYE